MARGKKITISKKVKRAAKRAGVAVDNRGRLEKPVIESPKNKTEEKVVKKQILIPQVVPVRKLAEILDQPITAVIGKLFQSGVQAAINESVDFDTAAIIADDFNYTATKEESQDTTSITEEETKAQAPTDTRPPVVTVMGHVDHGKTKLLDAIRSTKVIEGESGGITQHIGAYRATVKIKEGNKDKKRIVAFIDTPGHEAFSSMRAHGANVTDIVVLVVAADDGVMPQTVEAISHARAAGVPIIVAINKIDKPDADPDKVKRQLAEHNLVPEEWGGQTPMIPVSAKTGKNIERLLEIIILTADLKELKTNPRNTGRGIVIESKVKHGLGPVATILVQDGTLRTGDTIIIGEEVSKIRTMEDESGCRLREATASTPVLISGLKYLPQVGSQLNATKDDKTARDIVAAHQKKQAIKSMVVKRLSDTAQVSKINGQKQLNVILKADVQGSLEAIKNTLSDIPSDEVKVDFINAAIGAVNETDVNTAASSGAVILAFRVNTPPAVKRLADSQKVRIAYYDIIYELVDDIMTALQNMLEPEVVKTNIGKLKILKIFRRTQTSGIVGGLITKGFLRPGANFVASRDKAQLGEGKITSLKIGPSSVDKIEVETECGIEYSGNFKFKIGDVIDAYQTEEIIKTLKK
jgi:translation initiation factor IF-2